MRPRKALYFMFCYLCSGSVSRLTVYRGISNSAAPLTTPLLAPLTAPAQAKKHQTQNIRQILAIIRICSSPVCGSVCFCWLRCGGPLCSWCRKGEPLVSAPLVWAAAAVARRLIPWRRDARSPPGDGGRPFYITRVPRRSSYRVEDSDSVVFYFRDDADLTAVLDPSTRCQSRADNGRRQR